MAREPLFKGLVIDEYDHAVDTTTVGDDPCYVVNDHGFRRHIPSDDVDRQVLAWMRKEIEGKEDLLTDQTAKMLGQDDIFSRAMIEKQLKNIEQQLDQLMKTGIPEEGRAYMGMMGFKITINVHGEIINIEQPGGIAPEDE